MSAKPKIPPTMRAWTVGKSSDWRVAVRLQNDFPTPDPPTGTELLIRNAYGSLDPGDIKKLRLIPSWLKKDNAFIGQVFAGTVIDNGPATPSEFAPGTRVFGTLNRNDLFTGKGTTAEYIKVPVGGGRAIAKVPEDVSLLDASALAEPGCMAGITVQKAGLEDGKSEKKRVLVNGASGGCGSMIVQFIKAMGIQDLVATCSGANVEFVKSLGCTEVIDYRANDPLHEYLAKEYKGKPFDVIIDTVGSQKLYTNSPKYLSESGMFVNIGDYAHGTAWTLFYWILNTWWPRLLGGTPRKYHMFSGDTFDVQIKKVVNFMKEGKIRAVVEKVYDMEDMVEGYSYIESKRVRGKLAVKVVGD